jgi:hypothetical protein
MVSNEFKVLVYVLSLRRYVPAISIQLHATYRASPDAKDVSAPVFD